MIHRTQLMGLGVRIGVIFHDFSDVYSRLGSVLDLGIASAQTRGKSHDAR